ncbi:MAG: 2-oxoglutarate dehydrogenase E1 component, partial [Rickettsia endosymbiont of Ixodes persulcatus]|nr:2-oxoglutarate dehydrogenase E1 component [Rickettsia endosymbiont of Ixodes persulcatus]
KFKNGENMKNVTCLFGDNLDVIEDIYKRYQKDSNSVSLEWRNFFSNGLYSSESIDVVNQSNSVNVIDSYNAKVVELLNFFRSYGHTVADLDPLKLHVTGDLDYNKYIDLNDKNPQFCSVTTSFLHDS